MDTTIHEVLADLRAASADTAGQGKLFERLMAKYFVTDPEYAALFEVVWLWRDWPLRWQTRDDGIDLVARERETGQYWAIQCKFFRTTTISKKEIDSFFAESGKEFEREDGTRNGFVGRIIVSTVDKWTRDAEQTLEHQGIPTYRLRLQNLADSPIDWNQFSLTRPESIVIKEKHLLRDHQRDAIHNVTEGFRTNDRGKLIMACGTGKTLTSLRLMETMVPANGRVLFLAPSISLVGQTLREWTSQATQPLRAFVVCSDTKVGRDAEDIRTHDLAYPATTDATKLAQHARMELPGHRTVVFSTYQSLQVVIEAQQAGFGTFDLIICDEAHRTTGLTLPGDDPSDFVKVHQNHLLHGTKRLYMTATPRIFADKSKSRATTEHVTLFSMDDETVYGPEFYRLGFGQAVERNLLSDYKVLIVAVDEEKMANLANEYNNAYKIDDKKAIDTRYATKIIGSWKGLSKQGIVLVGDDGAQETLTEDPAPMQRAVAFSRSIKDSEQTTAIFDTLVNLYRRVHDDRGDGLIDCQLDHVDGRMNALQRQTALEWLKEEPPAGTCRILSNARCLSEGIDVPALDAVIFFDTRESIVDIVQSVGRVMRKTDTKQYGYIILPVGIPFAGIPDYNAYVESDPQFQGIWKVIKALRAHDDSLVDEAEFRRKIQIITPPPGAAENDGTDQPQLPLDYPELPIESISEAVYAAIPKKLGDREYWSEWAKSVAQMAERTTGRIQVLLQRPEARAALDQFLASLRVNVNPSVPEQDAIDMLTQHLITRPVFEVLFEDSAFTQQNPVSQAMQRILSVLDDHAIASEMDDLETLYGNIRERVRLAKSDKARQDVIRNLYDTFFQNAFPRFQEKLGIVYTPVEIVDFILESVEFALTEHFHTHLTEPGVQILDPFTGTGTFIVRLLQLGLIRPEDLVRKYRQELHANEIVLLAYYIAAINIESAFHGREGGEYEPFPGIALTDTFEMREPRDMIDDVVLPENNARVLRQNDQTIRVIIGNPPYSAQQTSENDNNQNLKYDSLDDHIRATYVAQSRAKLVKNLFDSYVRGVRWASDRIKDQGVIGFVTNGSFITANNMDGLRKSLIDEFSAVYVFNLRGNARTQGEERRREKGNVFGEGTRTPIAITILVKNQAHTGPAELFYHDIGDYLDRAEKLSIIREFKSMATVPWQQLMPNTEGDWVEQRDPVFESFLTLGDKGGPHAVFAMYSQGVLTARDAWAYNFSHDSLIANMSSMINTYNHETARYQEIRATSSSLQSTDLETVVASDSRKISWTHNLKEDTKRGRVLHASMDKVTASIYRPYCKEWLYFDHRLNERVYQIPKLFPTSRHENIVIAVTGIGASRPFSTLATDALPNFHMHDTGQAFPLYWYERDDERKASLYDDAVKPDHAGYIRHDAITDWALTQFRDHYQDASIMKDDIFWYVYGVLHSSEYRTRFAANLKKMLPRIPFATDFWAFSRIGRELGQWHLKYETVEPYPVREEWHSTIRDVASYRVEQMRWASKTTKSVIIYNQHLTLHDIPSEASAYVVNGKSAIEWILERYTVKADPASRIVNDANAWSDDPRYILDLLKRIVRVSVESAVLIDQLPPLGV